jgi:hypothetical protein
VVPSIQWAGVGSAVQIVAESGAAFAATGLGAMASFCTLARLT